MKKRKLLPIFLSMAFFVAVLVIISIEKASDEVISTQVDQALTVTAIHAVPRAMAVELTTTAVTKSRWLTDISAQVNGVVETLNSTLEPGKLIAKDTILLKLNPVHLQTQLVQAQSAVSRAGLALTKEQHERTVAKLMVKKSDNAYARHEPQVASAQAELASAMQQLASAQKRLDDSQVKAPFNAVVIKKTVAPGKYVQAGQALFQLASSESIDVQTWLSEALWLQLRGQLSQSVIQVIDRQGKVWPASVRYVSPALDPQTKQRQLMLKVSQPFSTEEPLLSEQFVSVVFILEAQAALVKVPLGAVTSDGEVWSITQENTLKLEAIDIIEEKTDYVLIRFREHAQAVRRLVRYPLLSMLQGKRVTAEILEEK